jgi:hypothetical protein
MDPFTFYGDLLGIASAYRLGANAAYQKLNTFYNTVFGRLEPLCDVPGWDVHVQMFSDSLVVWGTGAKQILKHLQNVYLDLIHMNLLLRGALVAGALEKEPRVEARNFKKFLPTNDTLARAVGLEKTVKGARLLIEPALAGNLLELQPRWLTVEGYMENPYPEVPRTDVLRRICPTPSGTSHEFLYFWTTDAPAGGSNNYRDIGARLKDLAEFHDPLVAEHLRETLKLLRRSETRARDKSWQAV